MKLSTSRWLLSLIAICGLSGCGEETTSIEVDRNTAVCGNGELNDGEACDDGNKDSNDGCSNTCDVEPGWNCETPGKACTKNPAPSEPECGDGTLGEDEACDDGNQDCNDGCSDMCEVEPGWLCETPGEACSKKPAPSAPECGNSELNDGEACDDGNTDDDDGCSSKCEAEPGWICEMPGEPCTPDTIAATPVCGNGSLETGESCDDGNADNDDGCAAQCTIESGWNCPSPGQACIKVTVVETPVCGNGVIENSEICDDGNANSGDGCSAQCTTEPGWTCAVAGQLCTKNPAVETPVCGDSKINGDETCDDGNNTPGDGCSAVCTTESGWTCAAPGTPCTKTPPVVTSYCGNGMLDNNETCDDGNKNNNDGCSANCTLESGWICALPGTPCDKIQTYDKKSIRILAIGNSFSDDSMYYLYGILKDLGYTTIELGNLFYGACSLETHAKNLNSKSTLYNFKTIGNSTNGKWDTTSHKNYNSITAMKSQKWDFVSIQQNSPFSGVPSTYNEDLQKIIKSVQQNVPSAKIIWHMTWAFQQGAVRDNFIYYGKSQSKMYDMIIHTTLDKIVPNNAFSFIIPTGTAIQNLRTSFIGDNITRDGYHLTHNNGRFLAALMWAKKITNKDISKLKYRPADYTYTNRQITAMMEAVENAYYHPFVVTPSSDGASGNNYKRNDALRDTLKKAGYNPDNYTELPFGISTQAYYHSASTQADVCELTKLGKNCFSAILLSKETNGKSSIFNTLAATRIFSRYEIPEGSIIALKDNHQYRPEAWKDLTTINASADRPALSSAKLLVTDAKWWGNFEYRAFNISQKDRPALSDSELKKFASALAIFVPVSAPTAEAAAINAHYDLSKYKKLPLNLTYHAYWNPTSKVNLTPDKADDRTFPTKLFTNNSTASQLAATRIFTKKEIPNGSLIVAVKGYQYRPDAWEKLEEPIGSRPNIVNAATKDSIVVVDDAWWGSYNYRAFNLAESGKPALDFARQAALKDKFAIYVPK